MWKQGEHVALIGDTGSGKTFLESRLLDYRQYVIVLRTKADDISFPGYKKVRTVAQLGSDSDKYLLEPRYEEQARECRRALEMVWKQGGWTIAIDELYYATLLGLEKPINKLLTQGRSKSISVVCGMQRPTGITRFAISQATHVFTFQSEGRDVKTIADATTPQAKLIVPELKQYQFWYWNRKSKLHTVSIAQNLRQVL